MANLTAQPLTASDFAPFGQVLELGKNATGQRQEFSAFMRNARDDATLGLATTRKAPTALPLTVEWLERHPYSSQAFISIDLPSFLVLVCPAHEDGSPRVDELQVFLGQRSHGICYAPNVWHHPFAVVGGDGEYVTMRYDNGSEEDTIWHRVEGGPVVTTAG
jgi:ureidoglycolate lyase